MLSHLVDSAFPSQSSQQQMTPVMDRSSTPVDRPILPKPDIQPMEASNGPQVSSMPPPQFTPGNGQRSNKRPLDSAVNTISQDDVLNTGASYFIQQPNSCVFWNPKYVQQMQQPTNQQHLMAQIDTSTAKVSSISTGGSNSIRNTGHSLLSPTFSAPLNQEKSHNPETVFAPFGNSVDSSNLYFSSKDASDTDLLFSEFDFATSSDVNDLLLLNEDPTLTEAPSQPQSEQQNQLTDQSRRNSPTLIRIKDIAPSSCSTRGGSKVLIAGKWPANSNSVYVSFGKIVVPATILQPGLIKCYCPANEQPGVVELAVLCDDGVKSHPINFFYRSPQQEFFLNQNELLVGNDTNVIAKVQLLDLLQQLKDTIHPDLRLSLDNIALPISSSAQSKNTCSTTELLAVAILTEITSNLPPPEFYTQTVQSNDGNNWTLLHFAAALGYTFFAEHLLDLQLEAKLPPILEHQADTECKDNAGMTPLHIACLKGNMETAVGLFRRDPHIISTLNIDGFNPVGLAASCGHFDVVRVMQLHEDAYLNHMTTETVNDKDSLSWLQENEGTETLKEFSSLPIQPNSEVKAQSYDAASQHMFDLATHIIAALPERIKQVPSAVYSPPLAPTIVSPQFVTAATPADAFVVYRERTASHGSHHNTASSRASSSTNNANRTPVGDSGLSTPLSFSFEAPEAQQQQCTSPKHIRSHSPPPTPEQFIEYFNAPNFYLHYDFSHLTLSDDEQRRLYEAARVIQLAYRRYRESKSSSVPATRHNSILPSAEVLATANDRVLGLLVQQQHLQQHQLNQQKKQFAQAQMSQIGNEGSGANQESLKKQHSDGASTSDERSQEVEQAALVIQAYYRRYKQFIAYRKMTEAATVIQTQFRSYSAQKRFRQSRDAAKVIQNQYRMYRATNQRRSQPYRTGLGSSRRRSGSTSSTSSLAGLQSTLQMAQSSSLCMSPLSNSTHQQTSSVYNSMGEVSKIDG